MAERIVDWTETAARQRRETLNIGLSAMALHFMLKN